MLVHILDTTCSLAIYCSCTVSSLTYLFLVSLSGCSIHSAVRTKLGECEQGVYDVVIIVDFRGNLLAHCLFEGRRGWCSLCFMYVS